MRKHSGFGRGTGCYQCESCGRQTRETGVTAGLDWKACPDCFELAGYQNGISDNGPANYGGEYLALARSHASTIYRGGGREKVGPAKKPVDNAS